MESLFKVSNIFFFFNDTATTEIYTLSLHDALPILAWTPSHDTTETARRVQRIAAHREIGKHTSELQSPDHLVCRLLLEKKLQHEPGYLGQRISAQYPTGCARPAAATR